jgi:hypothetical protein
VVTGYRFLRYYGRAAEYVREGRRSCSWRRGSLPPRFVVFGTGVALLAVGPGGGIVLGLHKASFFVWPGAFGVHVLVYVLRVPGLIAADWGRGSRTVGATLRFGAVALAVLPSAGPWLHWHGGHD